MATCVQKTIDSNGVSVSYALEECLGKLPSNPTWYGVEPNSFSDFGAEIETQAREPITAGRQKKRGSVVGVTAAVAFEHDFTVTSMNRLLEGFFFASTRNKSHKTGSLNANAFGIIGTAGQFAITVSGSVVKLTSTNATAFQNAGLNAGDWIFIGGDGAATNRFDRNVGYARVSQVANNELTLDLTTFTPVAENGSGKTVHLYFSHTLKNETADNAIKKFSYTFERKLGKNSETNGIQSEYVSGLVANELTIDAESKTIMKLSMSFIGTDVEYRNGHSSQAVKGGTRHNPPVEDVYSAATNVYASRIYTNEGSLNPFDFVSSFKVSINNNASAYDAIGKVGAIDVNVGNFDVSGSVEAYFTTVEALRAVRENKDVGMFIAAGVANKGFVLDVPSMSLSGGKLNVEKNQPIKLPLESSGNESKFGFTASYNFFPYLPNIAMS